MKCRNPFFKGGKKFITKAQAQTLSSGQRLALTPFPCGRCIECRTFKAQCWTTRIIIEFSMFADSAFITLTYDEEHLPKGHILEKKELTKFFKRFRKIIHPKKIRYFAVGEYGTEGERIINPHYHIILFNHSYLDEEPIREAWALGDIHFGDVTAHSARYCTKYVCKGWSADSRNLPKQLPPEFMVSSRGKPGGVGATGIKEIAKVLRRSLQLKPGEPYKGSPIFQISFLRKNWPLDRYMRQKLNEELFLDPRVAAQKLYDYQEEIFEEHLTDVTTFARSIILTNTRKSIINQRKRKHYEKRGKL